MAAALPKAKGWTANGAFGGEGPVNYVVVFLGAGLGGVLRHAVNVASVRWTGGQFPYSTLIVNVAGSLAIGLLAGWFAHRTGLDPQWKLFLATGILGGFTTFSAFSLDVALLIERNDHGLAALYVAGSVLLSIAAVLIGLLLFRSAVQLP